MSFSPRVLLRAAICNWYLPDSVFVNHTNNTIYVIEKKFQEGSGSVDEKLQTCDFKKRIYQKLYKLSYEPESEVLITNGATEAIYATVQALVEPGDEVVAFEPLFDSYASSVQMARGILKPVTLHLPDFRIDVKELASQVSEKTKLLIFNNPHNPTGRVFDKEEINEIAKLAEKYDFYILRSTK